MNRKSISEKAQPNSGCGRAFIGLFGFVFLSFGVFFIVIATVLPYLKSRAAESWESAPCKIVSSRVESHTDSDGDRSYSAEIEYDYTLDGGTLRGDQHSFSNMSGSSAAANKIVNKYPVGFETNCYFDPSDPSQSVLNREFDSSLAWMALFPLIFVVIGGVAILAAWSGWGFKGSRKTSKASARTAQANSYGISRASAPTGESASADVEDEQWSVPMKLKTKQSRWATIGLAFGFATFWNGIVGIFVAVLIFGSNGIWNQVLLGLFLTPFVLIGIFLLVACGYLILQLFSPRVQIALSRGAVPLGGTVDLAWEVMGRTNRLEKLKLEIQAEQVATFRRGTETRTDQEVFELIPVAELDSEDAIQFGSAVVTIPADTMHTHEGENNQVVWSVVVHGEIGWWPDINDSFPFRVTPGSKP